MTKEITKAEWKQFFDDLSREKLEWKTKIEVMDQETGAQILDEGLPLGGFTYEEATGEDRIEIIVGRGTENHQTHTITNPEKVYYQQDAEGAGGVVEIEGSGTKTLVHLIEPASATRNAEA